MPEALPTLYCVATDLESIFTANGVLWRLDDDADDALNATETQNQEDVIREATDIVNSYALHHYTAEALAESRVVTRWTAYVACHLLSRRRGNPAQFQDEYEAILKELDLVAKGLRFIPRLATFTNFQPKVDNYKFTPVFGSRCKQMIVDEEYLFE